MMTNNDNTLIEELIAAGFDQQLAQKAVANAPQKTFDSAIEYIEKLQELKEKKKVQGTVNTKEREKEKEKIENERKQMEEYLKRQKEQQKRDQEYLKNLKEKIEAERIEKLNEDNKSSESDVVKTNEVQPDKDDCQVKLRLESGSKVIYVNKNETLAVLFDRIATVFGSKKFAVFDLNYVPINMEEKTLDEAGFYPNKMVLVNRK